MTRPLLTVLLLLAAASSVRADQSTPPRFELGATVSALAPILAEGPYFVVGVGPRVTFNASRSLGFELGIEKVVPSESSGINTLYTTQLKIPLRRGRSRTLSLTAGAAGLVSFRHRSEVRTTRLDQSIVVHPSFRQGVRRAPQPADGWHRAGCRDSSSCCRVIFRAGDVRRGGRVRDPRCRRDYVRPRRLPLTRAAFGVAAIVVLTTACRSDDQPASYVIAGPTVPSAVTPLTADVWDSREELAVWTENVVARGTLALEGTGTDAFIRIERGDQPWLVRGPDLTPPSAGIRTVRLRYRWQPSVAPSASQTHFVTANCETVTPVPLVRSDGAGGRPRHPPAAIRVDGGRSDARSVSTADRRQVPLRPQPGRQPRSARNRPD